TGLSASDLGDEAPQLGLFDRDEKKRAALNRQLDKIADRFGTRAVVPADLLDRKRSREE
ncbi:MAG: DNA polymerase IV, partial [Deltaproteobacteria bacterium]|nr:DNA polymerase IV [Deltaproteobacteria bacterium]